MANDMKKLPDRLRRLATPSTRTLIKKCADYQNTTQEALAGLLKNYRFGTTTDYNMVLLVLSLLFWAQKHTADPQKPLSELNKSIKSLLNRQSRGNTKCLTTLLLNGNGKEISSQINAHDFVVLKQVIYYIISGKIQDPDPDTATSTSSNNSQTTERVWVDFSRRLKRITPWIINRRNVKHAVDFMLRRNIRDNMVSDNNDTFNHGGTGTDTVHDILFPALKDVSFDNTSDCIFYTFFHKGKVYAFPNPSIDENSPDTIRNALTALRKAVSSGKLSGIWKNNHLTLNNPTAFSFPDGVKGEKKTVTVIASSSEPPSTSTIDCFNSLDAFQRFLTNHQDLPSPSSPSPESSDGVDSHGSGAPLIGNRKSRENRAKPSGLQKEKVTKTSAFPDLSDLSSADKSNVRNRLANFFDGFHNSQAYKDSLGAPPEHLGKKSRIYGLGSDIDLSGTVSIPDSYSCDFFVFPKRSLETANYLKQQRLVDPTSKFVVMNLANYKHPGGGVESGALAQEEALCRTSNLYDHLTAVTADFYTSNRNADAFGGDRAIYTTDITQLYKDVAEPKDKDFLVSDDRLKFDCLTVAGPNLNNFDKLPDKYRRASDDDKKKMARNILTNRIDLALKTAIKSTEESTVPVVLVLGALGCGAFGCDPNMVSDIYYDFLINKKYAAYFDAVAFGILVATEKDKANYNSFYETFKTYINEPFTSPPPN